MSTFLKCSLLIPYYQDSLIICLLWLGLFSLAYTGESLSGGQPSILLPILPTPHSALIIENNQYEVGKLGYLLNNNAKNIAKALEEKGFEVILKTNLNRREMNDAIHEFKSLLLKKGGIGLFYFSGYGRQVDGKNYLLPINNAQLKDEVDLKYEAIPLDKILEKMQKTENDLNIIVLDVSPETPDLKSRYKKDKKDGLAKIAVPPGIIIGYATIFSSATFYPGLYTKHLIQEIQAEGRIDDVFMRVSNAVKEASRHQQIPWHQASLTQVRCFGECRKNPFLTEKKEWFLRNSFIAFATSMDGVVFDARDGEHNSLYTKHLLRFIDKPDLSIEQIFRKVTEAVEKESHGKQLPRYYPSITNKFSFIEENRDIRKIALVIGNAHYEDIQLSSPVNNAEDMAQALEKLGFKVIVKVNVNQQTMQNAIREFVRTLGTQKTIGLFYFVGYGAQVDGKDSMFPIDAREFRTKYNSLRRRVIKIDEVLNRMQNANQGLNLIILDMCRK